MPKHFSGFVNRQLFPKADTAKDFTLTAALSLSSVLAGKCQADEQSCDGSRRRDDLRLAATSPESGV